MSEDKKGPCLNDFNDTKDLAAHKLNLLSKFFFEYFKINTGIVNDPPSIICDFMFDKICQEDAAFFRKSFVECNALFKYRDVEDPFRDRLVSAGATSFPTSYNYQIYDGQVKVSLKIDIIGIYLYLLHLDKIFNLESKKLQHTLCGLIEEYESWKYKFTRI